jgi:capsular polysaccharide biosynthesis protein
LGHRNLRVLHIGSCHHSLAVAEEICGDCTDVACQQPGRRQPRRTWIGRVAVGRPRVSGGTVGSAGNTAKVEAIATLKSENLTRRFIQDHNLLPLLFSKKWDERQLKWKTSDPDRVPTLWKGNDYFAKNVRRVTEDTKTGLVTLTVTWTQPQLAAEWANNLVELTNDFLRDKAIQESERNVAYLADQAEKTKAVPVRDSIYNLMESEIKKEMVARGSKEYALKVIDPAVIPERHSSPQKPVWAITGFLIGFITSSAFLLMRARERDR